MLLRYAVLALVLMPAHRLRAADAPPDGSRAEPFDPTTAYAREEIAGWRVYFNRRLLAGDPALAERTRSELARQLAAIAQVVPKDKLSSLRQTRIWVERFHPKFPCACYHPSADWLRDNGFNPDKIDSVDISNPENFVQWTRAQPWMILHELAHAYHDQVLKHGHRGVRRAYEQAKESGAFERVKHVHGQVVRHYALNNDEEYFAETTEAYFGRNDFAPFDRAELKEFDPAGYKLMQQVWGHPAGDSSSSIAK